MTMNIVGNLASKSLKNKSIELSVQICGELCTVDSQSLASYAYKLFPFIKNILCAHKIFLMKGKSLYAYVAS